METKAKELRSLVDRLKGDLTIAETNLKVYVGSCRHAFSQPIYDPIYYPAYTIPGDPPGTMGVDWQGPTYVPEQTTKRWKRECSRCGEIECTSRIKEIKHELPDF